MPHDPQTSQGGPSALHVKVDVKETKSGYWKWTAKSDPENTLIAESCTSAKFQTEEEARANLQDAMLPWLENS